MQEKVLRCAIYIRVSTTEQRMHGKSLEAQETFLRDYATQHNMVVVGVYADEGRTARKELRKRKAIHTLLASVKRNEVDIIIFWKMDRWFRNVADFYKVQDILDQHNVKWLATAEPNINLETREGRLNLNIMLSIGQNEVDTTSERIVFVNQASVQQGKVIFGDASMPWGYKVGKVNGIKRMVIDDEAAPYVKEAFAYYFQHHTKTGTVKYMNRKYGNIMSINVMLTMCKNTMYYGCYRDNENYCPAYITKEQYQIMQEINNRNIRIKAEQTGKNVYLFSGLIKCPKCGRIMGGSGRQRRLASGEKRLYKYYRCLNHYGNATCDFTRTISDVVLEKYLLTNLDIIMYQRMVELKKIKEKSLPKKEVNRQKIEKEIERLNNMYQKGRISEQKYDDEYTALSVQLVKSEKIEPIHRHSYDNIRKLLDSDWHSVYNSLDRENQRAFWINLIEHIDIAIINDSVQVTEVHFY